MAQYHHVIFYDTAREEWFVDRDTDAYLPDGEVWDYAGSQEWQGLEDNEIDGYMEQVEFVTQMLNSVPFSPEPLG